MKSKLDRDISDHHILSPAQYKTMKNKWNFFNTQTTTPTSTQTKTRSRGVYVNIFKLSPLPW